MPFQPASVPVAPPSNPPVGEQVGRRERRRRPRRRTTSTAAVAAMYRRRMRSHPTSIIRSSREPVNLPGSSGSTRSACSITSGSWVAQTIVAPCSCAAAASMRPTTAALTWSSREVGSSTRSRSGSHASARAMATRWRSPAERRATRCSSRCSRPKRESQVRRGLGGRLALADPAHRHRQRDVLGRPIGSRQGPPPARPRRRGGAGTPPPRSRRARRSPARARPPRPPLGCSIPASSRRTVLLPEPDRPVSAVIRARRERGAEPVEHDPRPAALAVAHDDAAQLGRRARRGAAAAAAPRASGRLGTAAAGPAGVIRIAVVVPLGPGQPADARVGAGAPRAARSQPPRPTTIARRPPPDASSLRRPSRMCTVRSATVVAAGSWLTSTTVAPSSRASSAISR